MDANEVAAAEFQRIQPEDWDAELREAALMLEVRNGPLGFLTTQDARDYWDELHRLLADAIARRDRGEVDTSRLF